MHHAVLGALINSALYLASVLAAGLVTGNEGAWKLALLAMGLTFMSHVAQVLPSPMPAVTRALVFTSWLAGIAAGIALLF